MNFEFPIEPGRIYTFARSVGDDRDVFKEQLYADPGQPLVTPPTFVRTADHYDPARPLPGADSPGTPDGAGGFVDGTRVVHAEQHFEKALSTALDLLNPRCRGRFFNRLIAFGTGLDDEAIDVPGIIGTLGQTMGRNGVNIANFTLGRSARGKDAIALLYVDDPIPQPVIEELMATGLFQQVKPLVFNVA